MNFVAVSGSKLECLLHPSSGQGERDGSNLPKGLPGQSDSPVSISMNPLGWTGVGFGALCSIPVLSGVPGHPAIGCR